MDDVPTQVDDSVFLPFLKADLQMSAGGTLLLTNMQDDDNVLNRDIGSRADQRVDLKYLDCACS